MSNLQKARRVRVPLLLGASVPGVEHGEADLAVVVQVGVEAHRVAARRLQVDQHGQRGVLRREVHVQDEAAVRVRSVRRTGYEHLETSATSSYCTSHLPRRI